MLLRSPSLQALPVLRCSSRPSLSLGRSRRARVTRRAPTRDSKSGERERDPILIGDLSPDLDPSTLGSSSSSSSSSTQPLLALKEWSPVVAALASGEVTLLLRKGGIREPRFVPKARSFALVPTSHHTNASALRQDLFCSSSSSSSSSSPSSPSSSLPLDFDQRDPRGIDIGVAARVTGCWSVSRDENVAAAVEALVAFHPYRSSSTSTLARLEFRPGAPLTLLELRAFPLTPPVHVPAEVAEAYWGCRSWVELAETEAERIRESCSSRCSPALGDAEFLEKARALRQTISSLRGVESLVEL